MVDMKEFKIDGINRSPVGQRVGLDKNPSFALNKIVRRYVAMVENEWQNLAALFTHKEIGCMCEIFKMPKFPELAERTKGDLYFTVHTVFAVMPGVFEAEWGVDSDTILNKIHSLNMTQSIALADAIDRFWATPIDNREYDKLFVRDDSDPDE